MGFLVENDFLGRRIDLLGRQAATFQTGIGPLTIFTTNNSQWPSGGGKTFVVFVTVQRTDGGTSFAVPAILRINAGIPPSYDFSTSFFLSNAGNPVTIYVGTGLTSEVDLTIQPGTLSNQTPFTITLLSWAPNPPVPVVVSAYGWAE